MISRRHARHMKIGLIQSHKSGSETDIIHDRGLTRYRHSVAVRNRRHTTWSSRARAERALVHHRTAAGEISHHNIAHLRRSGSGVRGLSVRVNDDRAVFALIGVGKYP